MWARLYPSTVVALLSERRHVPRQIKKASLAYKSKPVLYRPALEMKPGALPLAFRLLVQANGRSECPPRSELALSTRLLWPSALEYAWVSCRKTTALRLWTTLSNKYIFLQEVFQLVRLILILGFIFHIEQIPNGTVSGHCTFSI